MSRFTVTTAALLVSSLAMSSVARAGTHDAQDEVEGPYSPSVALGLSLGVTAAGVGTLVFASQTQNDSLGAVGMAATFFGPSTGHWYAHQYLTRGLGVRGLGAVTAFGGLVAALEACPIFAEEGQCHDTTVGETLMLVGAGAYVVGTIDDIVTAPGAAYRANRALIQDVAIVPTLTPHQAGFAVSGRF
jgi:hypothetical protein